MEANEQNLAQMRGLFLQTLVPDNAVRKEAERMLLTVEVQPGFSIVLLHLISLLSSANSAEDLSIRQSASVMFKNLVKRRWAPDDEAETAPIHGGDRDTIKAHLVDLMCTTPPDVQKQLAEGVAIVAKYDFPEKWDGLLPQLVAKVRAPGRALCTARPGTPTPSPWAAPSPVGWARRLARPERRHAHGQQHHEAIPVQPQDRRLVPGAGLLFAALPGAASYVVCRVRPSLDLPCLDASAPHWICPAWMRPPLTGFALPGYVRPSLDLPPRAGAAAGRVHGQHRAHRGAGGRQGAAGGGLRGAAPHDAGVLLAQLAGAWGGPRALNLPPACGAVVYPSHSPTHTPFYTSFTPLFLHFSSSFPPLFLLQDLPEYFEDNIQVRVDYQ